MNEKNTYWASVILGVLALVTLIADVVLINGNRHISQVVGQRQQVISSTVTFDQLNKNLVQVLAQAAVQDDDKDIRALLSTQGITVKAKPGAGATDTKKK
jgi:mannose/fructose/N-acetylgalactosamine-specific phosphotransferase system component IID